ncbi:MAG: hypothetical protein LIO93_10470, partial [Bacteroidales bacterium]|nr:hypothetical protein [Bacteroidales bacterium]
SRADSIVNSNADSAEYILNTITDSDLSDKQLADYWRLRTKTHTLKGKSTVEDSMIVYSLEFYKKHNIQEELKESYKFTINHFAWKNDSVNYNSYMNEAMQFARQGRDSLFTSNLLRTRANHYYDAKNYKSAIPYYEKASEYNPFLPSNLYMIAISYSFMDKTIYCDSIDYWMNKTIALAKEQKDTLRLRHYYRNYADLQIGMKEYDKALENVRNMKKYSVKEKFSVESFMKANIYLQKHDLDSAQFYLNKMLEQDFREDDDRSFIFTKEGLTLLQNIIDYGRGETFDLSLIGRYTDSLYFDQLRNKLKSEEQITAKEKLKEENLKLTIRKQQIQLILFVVLFILMIGSGIIYLYMKKKKERLFQIEEKMESLQELLADVSDDLRESREKSSFFKKVLLQQLGIIRLTASNPTAQNQEMLHRMVKITNEEIPVDSLIVWEDLYVLIDSLYNNFYTNMKKTFGTILSQKELQLCCLLCANFTTKEISVISVQSVRTIYQRKSILRDKLNMDPREDIANFIRQNSSI